MSDVEEKTPADSAHEGPTQAFTPKRRSTGSRGLQIRCPHCANPVEMLVDTPYEEISCGSCGSMFSLINRQQETRFAAPLKRLGRFELVSRIGVGGFGSVWKARDTELDRIVALKIPRKGQLDPAEIEQFFREARAAAQLRHRNIVPVHEVGRHEETIFIVSDLVRGVDFGEWLSAKTLTSREAAELCRKVALALHHAHEHGIVHRDLKPSNIMIDEESEPNLMDFGLAKRDVAEITMTIDGQILGTPAYMSPEQAGGRSHWTDRRTDIYSLGVILFRLLTGELPFRGEAQMQIHQRLTEDAPDPRKLNRHIPRDIATICLKCLERDPNRRYSTAKDLAEEFDRFLEGRPIHARPLSRPERLGRWMRRKPLLATAATLTVVLAVGGPIVAIIIDQQRSELRRLVREKDNLINRSAEEKELALAQATQLRDELDRWKGRVNPWRLWPPRAEKPPQRQLLDDLYAQRYQPVADSLARKADKGWNSALSHLGLARLADHTDHKKEAVKHYRIAAKRLSDITNENPDDVAGRAALADCHERLAALSDDAASEEAQRHLMQASELYQQLAAMDKDPNVFLAKRMEVEMRAAAAGGYENAPAHLDEAARISRRLNSEWPNDGVELYRAVSAIAGEEPIVAREAITP